MSTSIAASRSFIFQLSHCLLNVLAVHYLPDERVSHVLGDDAFSHDGQITKQTIRAITLSALAPRPGELLWDVGSGSGSIAVEWCRPVHQAP